VLGTIEPLANPKIATGNSEKVPGGTLTRFILESESGIVVPLLLLTPKDAKEKVPIVVMVSQRGKEGFLKERGEVLREFLAAGIAVCLPDIRGTGETAAGQSAERASSRTSVSQTNLILGQPVIGLQVRDLCAVILWLRTREDIDGKRVALWGDSFANPNPPGTKFAIPLDAADMPAFSEPCGGVVASVASAFEDGIALLHTRGHLSAFPSDLFGSAYIYYPHDVVLPGVTTMGAWITGAKIVHRDDYVDALNRRVDRFAMTPAGASKWVIKNLITK
jgi:hypothetical protein